MLRGWRLAGAALALALAIAAFYATRLSYAPIYLIHDEVKFSLQAQAIAASGRDLNGRVLPLYFAEPEFRAGRDPVMIYVTALALKAWPLSQSAVRVPTALVGVLNCVLMFIVARSLFKSDWLGLTAAGFLALTPGHFIHSRMALSILYPLPFILAWLWCLNRYLDTGSRGSLIGAGAWLGVSIYSYLGCVVMAPIYLAFTVGAILQRHGWREWPRALPVMTAFLVALLPAVAWQFAYPDRFTELLNGYRVARSGDTLGASLAGILSPDGLRMRIDLFWSFFSPSFLFIAGDSSVINSTRAVGFFPIAFAVLIPVGLAQVAGGRGWPVSLVVAGGFFTAPVAAALSGELETNRVLYVLPFGALVATYGVERLLATSSMGLRWATAALLIAIPIQFTGFYSDYMGGYRARSSSWFGGNLPAALVAVIERSPQAIYLSRDIPYADAYWRFATIAEQRSDLIDRANYVDGATLPDAPAGALLVCAAEPQSCRAARSSPEWTVAAAFDEPNGQRSFEIMEKR
jgi:4-amino-4-deoxy-L-arabinose transferase-like glycosyltransferase